MAVKKPKMKPMRKPSPAKPKQKAYDGTTQGRGYNSSAIVGMLGRNRTLLNAILRGWR